MGIYDRDYYRREGPSLLGSFAANGQVTKALIGVNVLVFLVQMFSRGVDPSNGDYTEPITNLFSLNVTRVLHGEVWRLLTFAFLHDTNSVWHILMNMLILFMFGRQVESVLGGREYLRFYLVAAFLSGVAFVAATLLGLHKGECVGASGAVIAVLVLAACYNPRQVIYLFFVLPVPIWLLVVFYVAADAFNLLGRSGTAVATSAHLGGAAFGYLYHRLGLRMSGWMPSLGSLKRQRGTAATSAFVQRRRGSSGRAATATCGGANPAAKRYATAGGRTTRGAGRRDFGEDPARRHGGPDAARTRLAAPRQRNDEAAAQLTPMEPL